MIKHIVMWRLKDRANGKTRRENAEHVRRAFAELEQSVPKIAFMEVGINFDDSDAHADIVLNSAFESVEDLRAYQQHPAHQRIVALLETMRTEKRVVDYMV